MTRLDSEKNRNNDDEMIDLREVVYALYKEKHLILAAFVSCVALAVGYLAYKTPIYVTEAVLSSAYKRDLEAINRYELTEYSSSELFQQLFFMAKSRVQKEAFFSKNQKSFEKPGWDEKTGLDRFDDRLDFEIQKNQFIRSKEDDFLMAMSARFEYPEGMDGPQLLRTYTQDLGLTLKNKVLEDFIRLKKVREEQLPKT